MGMPVVLVEGMQNYVLFLLPLHYKVEGDWKVKDWLTEGKNSGRVRGTVEKLNMGIAVIELCWR